MCYNIPNKYNAYLFISISTVASQSLVTLLTFIKVPFGIQITKES